MSNLSKRTASESGSDSEGDSEEEETTKEKVQVGIKPQQGGLPKVDEEDEEDEEESSETDSDDDPGSHHDSVHKVVRQGPGPGPGVKAVASELQAANKRGREANGVKVGTMEEPANKKRKDTKDDKARAQALKSASPPKASKADPAAKTTRNAATGRAADKARPLLATKGEGAQGQAPGRKPKPVPPQVANSRNNAPKVGADKASPQKTKKTAHWSSNLEMALATLMNNDMKKPGKVMPVSRQDAYWGTLLNRLPREGELTELQVVDKVKRMRNRYHFLAKKLKEDGVSRAHFKNAHEEKLQQLWDGVWGAGRGILGAHTASEDESSDEDSAEAAVPVRGDILKQATNQQQESDDSSSDEEQDPSNARRKTAGLNQINSTGKPPAAVTPFLAKPRLEYTPIVRMDKRKAPFRDNEEMPSFDHHTGEVLGKEDGRRDDFMQSDVLRRVRADTASMFREFRLQLLDEFRGDRISALGGLGSRLGEFGGLEGLSSGQVNQLRKDWRDYRIKEISLQTEKMELVIREMRVEQELLKSRPLA